MDTTSPELDALLDEWIPDETAPPESPASEDGSDASVEDTLVQPEVAATEIESPPITEPIPLPEINPQLEAIQAELARVSEKAAHFDRLQEQANHIAAQRAEQARFEAWQKRIDDLENYAPEQKSALSRQIVAEIEGYRSQQYQAQVSERDAMAEESAKAFAAWYTVAQNTLPPEQFKALENDAKHLLQFQSPDAMKSQVSRDRALEMRGYERAKAELAAQQEAALARQAHERIASGADLVGVGGGAPAKGDSGGIDDYLDSLFG